MSAYEAAKAVGLEIGPRVGDYIDRRWVTDLESGETRFLCVSQVWAWIGERR